MDGFQKRSKISKEIGTIVPTDVHKPKGLFVLGFLILYSNAAVLKLIKLASTISKSTDGRTLPLYIDLLCRCIVVAVDLPTMGMTF